MPFQLLDVLIFFWVYKFFIIPSVAIGATMYLVRIFAFPLLSRNPCELVVIMGPDRVKIKRVKERLLPYFLHRKGAYWFTDAKTLTKVEGVKKKTATRPKKPSRFAKKQNVLEMPEVTAETQESESRIPFAQNKIHVYVDAVNQPVYDLVRMENKITDITSAHGMARQVKSHSIQIPPSFASFTKNWVLKIYSDHCELEATKIKQPFKVSFLTRLGVVLVGKEQAVESGNASDVLQSVTVQTVMQKIGSIEQNANFSASWMFQCIKAVNLLEKNWMRYLTGAMDMRFLLVVIGVIAVIAMYVLFVGPPTLPPPPAGVKMP